MDMIESRVARTGDGSHRSQKKKQRTKQSLNEHDDGHDHNSFWGYGDKEMTADDMKKITILRKLHG